MPQVVAGNLFLAPGVFQKAGAVLLGTDGASSFLISQRAMRTPWVALQRVIVAAFQAVTRLRVQDQRRTSIRRNGLFSGAVTEGRNQVSRRNGRGLRSDLGQEFLHFDVGEDDVRLPLKGFVVAPFETVSFLRGTDKGSGFYQKVFHLNMR